MRRHFPNAIWRRKNYYVRVDQDREGIAGFLEWLADYLTEASESEQSR